MPCRSLFIAINMAIAKQYNTFSYLQTYLLYQQTYRRMKIKLPYLYEPRYLKFWVFKTQNSSCILNFIILTLAIDNFMLYFIFTILFYFNELDVRYIIKINFKK